MKKNYGVENVYDAYVESGTMPQTMYRVSVERISDSDFVEFIEDAYRYTFSLGAALQIADDWFNTKNPEKFEHLYFGIYRADVTAEAWESSCSAEELGGKFDFLTHGLIKEAEKCYPYKDASGSVILSWLWHMYPGYARKYEGLSFGAVNDTELSIHTFNEERSFAINNEVLMWREEIDAYIIKGDKWGLIREIEDRLEDSNWKWNGNPDFEKAAEDYVNFYYESKF